jgi:hypothetical protein
LPCTSGNFRRPTEELELVERFVVIGENGVDNPEEYLSCLGQVDLLLAAAWGKKSNTSVR